MLKLSAFASIYLLASIIYCNRFGGGIVICFAKLMRVAFSGLRRKHDFLCKANQSVS